MIEYIGHGITVEDGSDFGAITYIGFDTDEEAVTWASKRFAPSTWLYTRICVESKEEK